MSRRERPARFRRALLLGAIAVGCDSSTDSTFRTSARLLDRYCQSGSYTLSGDADLVAGLSDDSCAFVLGPNPGAVTLPAATQVLVWIDEPENASWITVASPPNEPPPPSDDPKNDPNAVRISNPTGVTWHVVDARVEGTYGDCDNTSF